MSLNIVHSPLSSPPLPQQATPIYVFDASPNLQSRVNRDRGESTTECGETGCAFLSLYVCCVKHKGVRVCVFSFVLGVLSREGVKDTPRFKITSSTY